MGILAKKLPKLSISHSLPRFRFRSLSIRSKPSSNPVEVNQKIEFLRDETESLNGSDHGSHRDDDGDRSGNKVIVVVDSSAEAKGALDWALSHAIQSQDTVVLLYIVKTSRRGSGSTLKVNINAFKLLHSMKNKCQKKKPGVQVEVIIQEAREKGPAIVEEAKQQSASLLVLGQKRRTVLWQLLLRSWFGRSCCNSGLHWVQHCIVNASCMTIAVRRKGTKLGGFMITTKKHKNFWLLA